MKKRLLSMLLLVAMIVTALPLVALPAVAAEASTDKKVYEEADYNYLYVQDGLVFHADFFKTNEYWNTEGKVYKEPLGPSENTKYMYNGVEYDLTKQENRYGWSLVKGGQWMDNTIYATQEEANAALAALGDSTVTVNERVTPIFEAAWKTWKSDDPTYLRQFEVTPDNNMELYSYEGGFAAKNVAHYNIASYNTTKTYSAFRQGPGYIVLRDDLHTSGGFLHRNTSSYASDFLSVQYTASFGGATFSADDTIMMHNIRPKLSATADSLSVIGVYTNNFTESAGTFKKGISVKNSETDVVSFTMTLEGLVDSDGNDKLILRTEDGEMGSVEGAITRNDGNHIFSYGGTLKNARIYAIRYYNEELTQEELRQNHFADLVKFFRLDLSRFEDLTEAEMTALHTLAADYSIDQGYEVVAGAIYGAITERYGAQFDEAVIKAAKEYLLDLSPILGIPRGVFPKTYTLLGELAAGTSASADPAGDYEKAIRTDLEAYAASSAMTADQYNALYEQDGLAYAIDFFSSNSYWTGEGIAFTNLYNSTSEGDLVAFRNAMKEYAWFDGTGINWSTDILKANIDAGKATPGSVSVQDGYANLRSGGNINITGVGTATGFGFASKGGATAEQVMRAIGGGFMFNNVRAYFAAAGGLSSMQVQNDSFKPLVSPQYNGAPVKTNVFKSPVSLAMTLSIPDPTYNVIWGNKEITGSANSATVAAYVGTYTTVEGEPEPVLSVAATTTSVAPFFQPSMKKVAEVWYQNGVRLENPLTNVYVYFPNEQSLTGNFGLYENGKAIYENAATPFLNNSAAYDAAYANWSSCTSDLYAVRYYDRVLTPAELANNHFMDVAKFFRLNINGYETLSAADRATVAEAFRDVQFTDDRIAVQELAIRTLAPLVKASYDAMKNGIDPARDAFLDVAYEYSLAVTDLLAEGRDMSTVYERVTAAALAGKSVAAAQVVLDEAVYDAHYYLSYKMGDEGFDGFLGRLALNDAHLDTEALMALPWELRKEAASLALSQEAIDAFVEEKMAAYAPYGKMTAEDYDALYVQDGRLLMIDFFETNEYWGKEGVDMSTRAGVHADFRPYVRYVIEDATNFNIKHEGNGRGVIDGGYYRNHITADGADRLTISMSSKTMAGSDSFSAEYVYRYEGKPDQNSFYARHTWLRVDNSSYTAKDGATIVFGSLWNQFNRYNTSTWGSHHTTVHKFTNASYAIGHRAMPLSLVYTDVSDYLTSTTRAEGNAPLLSIYAPDLEAPIVEVNTLSGGELLLTNKDYFTATDGSTGTYLLNDGTYGSGSGKDYKDGYYGLGPVDTALLDYIGYNQSLDGRAYAIRYYSRALSQDETLQNHFADLVKFFRIDASALDGLSDADKLTVYKALRNCDMATSTREEVAAAYYGALNGAYATAYAALPAEMTAILEKAPFDATALLAIREENARAAIAAKLTAEYSADYALSAPVLAAELKEAMAFLSSIDFIGVQVRLETGDVNDEMPGVRSLFTIDKEVLKALLLAARETGEEVVLGATVEMTVGEETVAEPLYFYPELDGADNVTFRKGSAKLQEFEIGGKAVFGFAYTVTYKNYKTYSAEQAYTLYNAEYDYSFFVKVGEITYTRDVEYSDFKNGTVSAYKAYKHFADQGKYLDDPMMKEVLAKGAVAPAD